MVKRALGKTGIEVSEVAFGCVEIGMPYGIGVHAVQDMPTEVEAVQLLQTALQQGINFFDTARAYGTSENLLGKAFANRRNEVVIATKCSHLLNADGSLPTAPQLMQRIEASLQQSLDALQTDYVDIFMLHQADKRLIQSSVIADVFTYLKQSGQIKATGVSIYTCQQTEEAIHSGNWDVIQVPFNMLDQRQAALFNLANDKGIGLVIRSVLLKGLLTDKGQQLHLALLAVERHIQQYRMLAAAQNVGLSTMAIQFALSFPQVTTVLVGIDKLDYLQQSLTAAKSEHLSTSLLETITTLAYPEPDFIDLPKWDKEGWLK